MYVGCQDFFLKCLTRPPGVCILVREILTNTHTMTFSISITTPSDETLTRDYPTSKFDDLVYMAIAMDSLYKDAVEMYENTDE